MFADQRHKRHRRQLFLGDYVAFPADQHQILVAAGTHRHNQATAVGKLLDQWRWHVRRGTGHQNRVEGPGLRPAQTAIADLKRDVLTTDLLQGFLGPARSARRAAPPCRPGRLAGSTPPSDTRIPCQFPALCRCCRVSALLSYERRRRAAKSSVHRRWAGRRRNRRHRVRPAERTSHAARCASRSAPHVTDTPRLELGPNHPLSLFFQGHMFWNGRTGQWGRTWLVR